MKYAGEKQCIQGFVANPNETDNCVEGRIK
jgi:hypothetical protein